MKYEWLYRNQFHIELLHALTAWKLYSVQAKLSVCEERNG